MFLNNAPIYWMSKKQTAGETSLFGSEFTVMKLCTEYLRSLRYKLPMMGIPSQFCSMFQFLSRHSRRNLSQLLTILF